MKRSITLHETQDLNLREVSAFRGFNESTQYNGIFGYDSLVGPSETIKFEVGFRGDLMLKTDLKEFSPLGLIYLMIHLFHSLKEK